MATRSETTEEAVGPMPAPGPEKTVVPISSPSIAIMFVLPLTCAMGCLLLINLGDTSCEAYFLNTLLLRVTLFYIQLNQPLECLL